MLFRSKLTTAGHGATACTFSVGRRLARKTPRQGLNGANRTSGGDSSKPPNDISRGTVSRTRIGVKRPSRVQYISSLGSKEAVYRFVERHPGWCTPAPRQRSGGTEWPAGQRTAA